MGAGFGRNLLHPQSKNIPEDGDHRPFLNADTYLQTTWQHIPEDDKLYRTNLTCDKACNTITKMHRTFWFHILEGQIRTTVRDETAWYQFSTSSSSPTNFLYPTKKLAPFRYDWPQDPALGIAFPKLCTAFPTQLTPTPQRQQISSAMLVPMYQLYITSSKNATCTVFKNVWDNEKHTQIKFCIVCKEGSTNRNQRHTDRHMQI